MRFDVQIRNAEEFHKREVYRKVNLEYRSPILSHKLGSGGKLLVAYIRWKF